MRRYTTPTLKLIVEGVDITETHVFITMAQQRQSLTLDAQDMAYDGSDTTITVDFTQEQLADFSEGRAQIQVNWVDTNNKRNATSAASVTILGNLLERVVEYV